MNDSKYIHTAEIHNTLAAESILPFVFNIVSPNSVIDIGCGTGTWLKVCLDLGLTDIKGIDGDYVDPEQLVIPGLYFQSHDLETPLPPERKFDLVVSLEVAEHLKPDAAEIFIDTLTSHGDTILFSAAIKDQGGQNHINEQPPGYWEKLFNNRGYQYYDVIRPVFWKDEKIEWWYRQNIFLICKSRPMFNIDNLNQNSNLYIHPELYSNKINLINDLQPRYERLIQGKESPLAYFKLLLKSIFKNN